MPTNLITQPGFEYPALGGGTYSETPSASDWTFTAPDAITLASVGIRSSAGITTDSSVLTAGNDPIPEGSQCGFLINHGSFSITFTVPYATPLQLLFDCSFGLGTPDVMVPHPDETASLAISPYVDGTRFYAGVPFVVSSVLFTDPGTGIYSWDLTQSYQQGFTPLTSPHGGAWYSDVYGYTTPETYGAGVHTLTFVGHPTWLGLGSIPGNVIALIDNVRLYVTADPPPPPLARPFAQVQLLD